MDIGPKTTAALQALCHKAKTLLVNGTMGKNEESEYGHRQGVMESWRGYGVDRLDSNWNSNTTIDTSVYHDLTSSQVIFFTMHIAALFRQKKFYHAAMQDFARLGKLLNKSWPKPLPHWSNNPPSMWPSYSVFDTEYNPSDNDSLIRFSLCDTNYQTWVVEAIDIPDKKINIAPNSTVVMQNALADISHLANIVDFSQVKVEDLMLAHSVLWTGELHGLNYIASKYGAFNRYKHLNQDNPELYSALDAYEPMYIWQNAIIPDFRKDKLSWEVYQRYRLPLIQIIDKAQRTGVKVDTGMLEHIQKVLYERCQDIKDIAREITGDPNFSIAGHKQIKEAIYG